MLQERNFPTFFNKADTGAEAVVCLGVDFGKYLT